jgi:hypothetical protein
LSCKQIAEEAARVSRRAAEAAGVQDSQATKDSVVTGIAIVVFWPAAFFVGGDRANAAELGRLKGEADALEQVSIKKKLRHPISAGLNERTQRDSRPGSVRLGVS